MKAAIVVLGFVLAATGVEASARAQTVHRGGTGDTSSQFDQISSAATKAWSENRDQDAIALSRQGLRLRPEWDDGLWYLGTIFYAQQNYHEAREQLRHYLARHPQKGIAWALVGLCDYKLREYPHAGEELRRAISFGLQGRQELAGPVYYYSALLFTRDERWEESAADLYHLRRRDAGLHVDAPLEIPMGLNALHYAMLPEEIPADRIELARQTGQAVFARYEQRRDEAKSLLSQLLQQYPGEQGLHFQYGLILLEDHSEEGVEEMRKATELSPSNPEPRISIAQHYLDLGQKDKAQAFIDEALGLDPEQPAARVLKGEILSASGDSAGAIAQFERARTSAPSDKRILWELMRAYTKAGRKEDAAQIMKQLQELGEKSPAAE